MFEGIANIIGNVGGLANSFNYKKQENDLQMAQANVEIARANASANKPNNTGKIILIVLAVVTVSAIGYFLIIKKK